MNATHQAILTERDNHRKSFALVDPAEHARDLARRGFIRQSDAARITWRDPISALITDTELDEAGVTIEQVKEAIVFFTATAPRVRRETIARTTVGRSGPGYFVEAAGYRNGPAGP